MNRIESYFCRSAVAGQPISVFGHCSNAVNGKTFLSIPFSRAMATVATERNYSNGRPTTERQNGNRIVLQTDKFFFTFYI